MRLFPFKIGYILKELLNISFMVFINIDWRYDIVSIKQYDIDIMKPRSFVGVSLYVYVCLSINSSLEVLGFW